MIEMRYLHIQNVVIYASESNFVNIRWSEIERYTYLQCERVDLCVDISTII